MKSDLEIAQEANMMQIADLAEKMGVLPEEMELYGKYKAKVSLDILERLKDRKDGKMILVTAVTPTPLGEGKTVTTIGLAQSLNRIGKNAIATIRQPSMGPVFGIKGGAAGGGYSQVVPMEDINLHFTGDMHAVSIANNLLCAFIDNVIYRRSLSLDSKSVSFNRVVDMNDRSLRNVVIGIGKKTDGVPRQAKFDISAASEVMAILALATSFKDLKERLKKIIVGYTYEDEPITAEMIGCAGAMAALLRDAIKPNLVQTLENKPVFIHAGPFGNIAHGNSSIVADKIAVKLADYVVTEAGFGADMGMEKFMNIKCRYSGIKPSVVVVVATVRALKMHGGGFKLNPGARPKWELIEKENVEAVKVGCDNLRAHIENAQKYGVPVVVAINRFKSDTEAEIEVIKKAALEAGAEDACISEVHAKGSEGGVELAEAVAKASEKDSKFKFLYELDIPIKEKIETIAMEMYGADRVEYEPRVNKKIKRLTNLGLDKLPVCMAKTHLSLSDNPKLKNRPKGFVITVMDIKPSAGAGFLYPLLGEMSTMPGLPSKPAGLQIDVDDDGKISGLF